ncbi:MAG: NADH-quinone oxidoreductase subunit J [Paludisphaera borealis]|uniref:NADH-quinone oxidoreductase subunit J family protein n=1 Tax=Paludisphaera borealis TaxID=1387353 RepID=UPI002842DED0|nr:NADH-quinone oxidoreductase subunit J [Paludisphaera borealis]MDR3623258.1 NADH-quinone oxidoreductase subunit J [Paludisphaera borealis]
MFTGSMLFTTFVILLGAGGVYLLLPHRHGQAKTQTVYIVGAVLAGFGLVGFLSFLSAPAELDLSQLDKLLSAVFFYSFSASALGCGVMTVTSRNPIYSALWFAGVVLSTAGLFLLAGAQFLAAGTVIVYAGAIIVTFLFVIMLAQMEGKAVYDRSARTPGAAVLTCFLLLGALVVCLVDTRFAPVGANTPGQPRNPQTFLPRGRELAEVHQLHPTNLQRIALEHALRSTSSIYTESKQEKPDVAGLGESLYADHLLTVELAGSLLFAALIAAVAITNPKRPVRPGDPEPIGTSV